LGIWNSVICSSILSFNLLKWLKLW
jgi:hypothetical protein